MIRASTLWTLWLTRNKICFNNTFIPSIVSVASAIITLASYWCKARSDDSFFKLTLLLPFDVAPLYQTDTIIVLSDSKTLDWGNSRGLDPALELEGSDLEDYLVDLVAYQEIDSAAGLLPHSVSAGLLPHSMSASASSSSSSSGDDLDNSFMDSNPGLS